MADKKGRGISNLPVSIPDVPDAPTVSAVDVGTSRAYNNGAATVTLTSPTGGLPTSYSVTTTPTTTTTVTSTSPVTLTGLSSATAYTVSATATNGSGVVSSAGTSGSFTATSVPQAPTIGVPTVATGQAYTGNANVSVPFTPGATGGKTVSTYTVTSSSGNTNTGASSPITVSDVVGTARTYTVTATNANGVSSASSASASTTPSSVPQAPTIGTATASGLGASVAFTANSTGGSAITSYTATSSPGSITGTGASSPITVSGLSAATSYTFTVTATNANGTSSSSSASNSITTQSPAFESIATAIGTGSSNTITFSSIPGTYKDLQIRGVFFSSSNYGTLKLTVNGDSGANYYEHSLTSQGGTPTAGYTGGTGSFNLFGSNGTYSTYPLVGLYDVKDYANTSKNKTFRIFSGMDTNGVSAWEINLRSGGWFSTSAITSLTITLGTGNFTTATKVALYGIKAS